MTTSKTYLFEPETCISENFQGKYWIDRKLIDKIKIDANSLDIALSLFADYCLKESYVKITKNGLKTKNGMYTGKDTQIGFVINANTEIDSKTIQLQIWVKISQIIDIFN